MKTTILQQDPPFIIKALEYLPGGVTLDVNYRGWGDVIPAGMPVIFLNKPYLHLNLSNTLRFEVGFVNSSGRIIGRSHPDRWTLVGITAHSVPTSQPFVSVLTRGIVNAQMLPELKSRFPIVTWQNIAKALPNIEFLNLPPA